MHGYMHRTRQRSRRTSQQRKRTQDLWPAARGAVVTLVEPSLRSLIDNATENAFAKVHADSVSEAFWAIRAHAASALILSAVVIRRESVAAVGRLVIKGLGVTPVAVVLSDSPTRTEDLLDLGACGVRMVLDLSGPDGWHRLRSLVEDTGGVEASTIRSMLLPIVQDASCGSRRFFGFLVQSAPRITTVQELAASIGLLPSTLMSRFFRASLPSPKLYLAMTRLLYAASYLEQPAVSVADVANRLLFSSPQSFGRHVRSVLGVSAGEFRRRFTLSAAFDHFNSRLIEPYQEKFRFFDPLADLTAPGRHHATDLAITTEEI